MQNPKKKACVIGWPVEHSLSPKLHGIWIKQYGLDAEYVTLPLPPEKLDSVKTLPEQGFCGANITIPHKEDVIAYLDQIDVIAQDIGAVNTLQLREGKRYGSNTDAYGFIENLKIHVDLTRYLDHAVVLGGGGGARAVVWALLHEGAKRVSVVVRTPEKAEPLKAFSKNVRIVAWDDLALLLPSATLLVNTTPLGMEGKEPLHIPLEALNRQALVTDIVYTPVETELLQAARRQGNAVVDGLGMLIFQAVPGFETWFNVRPQVDMQRLNQLKKELQQP